METIIVNKCILRQWAECDSDHKVILGSEERGGFRTSAISLVHRTSEASVALVWPPEASPSDPSLLVQYHFLHLPASHSPATQMY